MRYVLALSLLMMFSILVNGQGVALGSAMVYGSEINSIGFQGRSYLFLNESVCFGPEFNYFLPRYEEIEGHRQQRHMIEANFNIHYVLHLNHKAGFYPLTGVNFTSEWEGDEPHADYSFAANLGGGFHYFAGRWMPFVEYLYTFNKKPQQSVLLGFFFVLTKPKEGMEMKSHKMKSNH